MPCPTCDHTLHGIGHGMRHCPRCGTLSGCYADGSVTVPALVERCRRFAAGMSGASREVWNQFGIAESIDPPDRRPAP